MKRLLFIVSEDWYFVSHRLHLAEYALKHGYEVFLLCRTSKYKRKIESVGVRVFEWRIDRGSLNPFLELRALYDIMSALRAIKPDIVHSVSLKPVLYAAIISKFTKQYKFVHALTGMGFVFSSEKKLVKVLQSLLLKLLRLLFNEKHIRLVLQNYDDYNYILKEKLIQESNVYVIRGAGVDTQYFSPNHVSGDVPIVILPARMLWSKGVGEFVDAARRLHLKGIEARFVLVGKPDTKNPDYISASQIDVWINEGVIEAWGVKDDMANVLNQASIVCLPSYREGLPKALLEGASCGLPIVAFDVPGCREIVIDNENGFLVPVKDVVALSESLELLLEKPKLCCTMGSAGRDLVLKNFSQEKIASETLNIWVSF